MFERETARNISNHHSIAYRNRTAWAWPDISDTWTLEQRERFLRNWKDDRYCEEKRSYDEMMDDEELSPLQVGRGQKRSHKEMSDGEISNKDNSFVVESVKQVIYSQWRSQVSEFGGGAFEGQHAFWEGAR